MSRRRWLLTFEVSDAGRLQHGILYLPTLWSIRRRRPGTSEEEVGRSRD